MLRELNTCLPFPYCLHSRIYHINRIRATLLHGTRANSIAETTMRAPEDHPMLVVIVSLILILATTIFLLRRSLRWLVQRPIVPAIVHPRPSSEIDCPQNPAYEVSTNQDVPEGWFTDAKVFSLERRAIFATVGENAMHTYCRTNKHRHGFASLISPTSNVLEII